MSLEKGQCPNCNEFIEVESEEFNVICKYCGVPFFPREAITKYQTYLSELTSNLSVDTVNVNADNISNYATLGLAALKEKNHEKCGFYADDILKRKPSSSEGLLLKAYFISDNYSKEEGIRYYFLALSNTNDQSLRTLIFNTFKEELNDYSIENYQFLFNEIKKNLKDDYLSFYRYALMRLSSELEDEALISFFDIELNEVENNLNQTRKVIWSQNGYELSLLENDLIYSKYGVIKRYIILDQIDENVEKYQNKKNKKHLFSYYFYLNERILSINLEDQNAELEKIISDYHLNLNSIHSGCYVATCVYGSYNTPEVWTLRRYRDETLSTSFFGRMFIKLYYFLSPKIISLFGKQKWFHFINRKILNAIVHKLRKKGYGNTPYRDKR